MYVSSYTHRSIKLDAKNVWLQHVISTFQNTDVKIYLPFFGIELLEVAFLLVLLRYSTSQL